MVARSLPRIGLLVPLLLWVESAGGFCREPHPKPCAEFFKSDAVFTANVVTQRIVRDEEGDIGAWVYRLRVQTIFRGTLEKTVEVITPHSSVRLPLAVGKTYLLFASKHKGQFGVFNCGNSALVSKAASIIAQVRRIKDASGGEIEGWVEEISVNYSSRRPAPGVSIIVQGEQRTYTGVTGEDGWFHIPVLAGMYKVRAESSSARIQPFDLSYDDPAHVVVHDGGCGELKFLAFRGWSGGR